MKKLSILLFSMMLLNLKAFSQAAPVTIWSDPIADINPSASNPFNSNPSASGYIKDSHISVSGIGRGSGLTPTSTPNRYDATDWTTGSSLDPNDYFTFTLTPNAGFRIYYNSLNFDYQRSNTNSPTTYQLYSSLDGFTTPITTGTLSNTSNTSASVPLTAPAFQNTTGSITFRLYAYNAAATTAALGINDFAFTGIVASSPLNLQLTRFSGQMQDQKVVLQWSTTCENNLKSFEIEKASGNGVFATTESIAPENKGCSETGSYQFTDLLGAGVQLYRLKITTAEGNVSYSNTLNFNAKGTISDVLTIQPNPAAEFIRISGIAPDAVYVITDMTGKIVAKATTGNGDGYVSVGQLQSGLYFVNVTGQKTVKFVKL